MNKRFFSQQGVYPRHISARFPERQREIIRSSAYNFTEKLYENENVQTHIHAQRKMERERTSNAKVLRTHWMGVLVASEKRQFAEYTVRECKCIHSKSNIFFSLPSFSHYITFISDESHRRQYDIPQCDAVWRHVGAEFAHLIQRKIKV